MTNPICPKCTMENRPQARFCIHCGAKLPSPAAPPPPPLPSPPPAQDAERLEPGMLLAGRYTIREPHARGGYTTTYPAWDNTLQMRVLVEQVLDRTAEQLQRSVQALQNYSKLSHPQLARLVDIIRPRADSLYVVSEAPEGKNLDQVLQASGPLPETDVLAWLVKISAALIYLSEELPNFTTLDIAPQRILLSSRGTVQLMGVCEVEFIGDQWVRPGYSPPEQYMRKEMDERSAVYSLGATLYCLLTGEVPPDAADRVSGTLLKPPRQLRPDISGQVEGVIRQALELEPKRRFASIAAFSQALESVDRSTGSAAVVPSYRPDVQYTGPLLQPTASPSAPSRPPTLAQQPVPSFAPRPSAPPAMYTPRADSSAPTGALPPMPAAPMIPMAPAPAGGGAPSPSRPPMPSTNHPRPAFAGGRGQHEITRFGRVEYSSPMDVGQEYLLRIGLLIERHGRRLMEGARVHWSTLHMASMEEEPIIRITPSSGYLSVSPPFRDIKVSKLRDVFADFRLTPHHVGSSAKGACQVQVDFEYQGEIIHQLCLDARIQDPFKLGPIKIPHKYWKGFGLVGGGIASFETAASLFNLYNPAGSLLNAALFAGGLFAALLLVLFAIVLWQRAARRLKQRF